MEITKENGMVGSGGGLDYLRIVQTEYGSVGIKLITNAQKCKVFFGMRIRYEGDPQGRPLHLPLEQKSYIHSSFTLGFPMYLRAYETASPEEVINDLIQKGVFGEIIEKIVQPLDGILYTPDQFLNHMVGFYTTALAEYWPQFGFGDDQKKIEAVDVSAILNKMMDNGCGECGDELEDDEGGED